MIFKKLFLWLSILTLFATAVPVYATEPLEELEYTTSDLENELSGLNDELANLNSELSSIMSQIQVTAENLETTKSELAIAKGKEEVQYEAMTLRIQYMYENGNTSIMEMLLSSGSIAEFLNHTEYYTSIMEYDRGILNELIAVREDISEREQELLDAQAHLADLQESLNQKEELLSEKIANTSEDLSQYTAQLEAAREEIRKAEEAAKEEVEPIIPEEPAEPEVLGEPAEPETPEVKEELDEPNEPETPEVEMESEEPDEPETPEVEEESDEPDEPETPEVEDETDKPADPETPNESEEPEDSAESVLDSASDLELFAALLECEAGTSDYEALLAVASVVVNRMNSSYYPDTVRGVIFQSGQFPPATNGKVERVLSRGVTNLCVTAAQDALAGKNNVGDCLQFRAASSGHVGLVIGDNVFF